jgi:hypothetical protein
MCDYSLYTIPNRLAEEGEELVLRKFETGTLGFASLSDLIRLESTTTKTGGFWSMLKDFISPPCPPQLPAVCIAPGARLLLNGVPRKVQTSLCVGRSERVVFTELSERSYSYRDALLLPNGTRVLLQDLPEGLHAVVLSMSSEPRAEAAQKEPQHAAA